MNHEQAMAALIRLVDDNRQARCRALLAEGEARARAIRKEAFAAARRHVREALEAQRRHDRMRLARAEAEFRTRQRLARQQRARTLLESGWRALHEALLERWRNASGRRAWVRRSAAQAAATLPREGWEIRHPAEWARAEQDELQRFLVGHGIAAPRFHADSAIKAGLRLAAGHNVLDATLAGLLADRAAIEARMLYHLAGEAP